MPRIRIKRINSNEMKPQGIQVKITPLFSLSRIIYTVNTGVYICIYLAGVMYNRQNHFFFHPVITKIILEMVKKMFGLGKKI